MSHSDVSSIMKGQVPGTDFWRMVNRSWQIWPKAISLHLSNAKFTVSSCLMYLTNNGKLAVLFNWITMNAIHFLCETFRVYSLVDPCCLQDLMLLAMLGSVSGQCGLSGEPVAWLHDGFKMAAAASRLNPPLNSHKDLALLFTLDSLSNVISCCVSCQTAPSQLFVKSASAS